MKQIFIKASYNDNELSNIAMKNTFYAIPAEGLNTADYNEFTNIVVDICHLQSIVKQVRDFVKEAIEKYGKMALKALNAERFTKVVSFKSKYIPAVEIVAVFE